LGVPVLRYLAKNSASWQQWIRQPFLAGRQLGYFCTRISFLFRSTLFTFDRLHIDQHKLYMLYPARSFVCVPEKRAEYLSACYESYRPYLNVRK
jgi:hypothetical protein